MTVGPLAARAPGATCFAPHLDVNPVDDLGLVVLRGRGHEVFAGPEYVAVARAVDGVRSEAQVVQAAARDMPVDDVRRAVEELRSAGVLVELDPTMEAVQAYWTREGQSPSDVAERLARATASVAAVGAADGRAVSSALIDAGLRLADDGELLVVVTDDYLRDDLRRLNEEALQTGQVWMPAAPEADEIWIGPAFVPDRGPCWECLAQRLRRHRSIEAYLHDSAQREIPIVRPPVSLPATRMAAAGVIAAEAVRLLALGPSARRDHLLSVDTRTWHSASHPVIRRPQCPACGFADVSTDQPAPPVVVASPTDAGTPGRAAGPVPPETTVERFEHHVSPITGSVAKLVPAAGTRPPLFVYVSGDPGPRVHGSDRDWSPGAHVPPGGKGPSEAQARASALCEALERYSGEFAGDEPRRTGTLADLAPTALHPNECMQFSAEQYAHREEINAEARSLRTRVPTPFDPEATVEWTPLWSLTAARERLLPTSYCYYAAHVAGYESCVADSNGNAAGNTLDEAVLNGLLELVERDHVALWWYNRLRLPAVDLDSLGHEWLDEVRKHFAREGRRLWALDLTADLGIPVVAALAASDDGGRVGLGFGAHLDLRRAAVRAVTELVQLSAGVPSGAAGYGPPEGLDAAKSAYLHPDDGVPARTPADAETLASGDLPAELNECRRRVEERGMEVMVLDQTRPDIGLPVVKVVVPGLRHFWPRFAPGRLYDVPVALGRLAGASPEASLNPVPPAA